MAELTRNTVRRLAVLYGLSAWRRGAFGETRIHKTLFFADSGRDVDTRLFTYRHYFYGQYTGQLAGILNSLGTCGRLRIVFDGPSARYVAKLESEARSAIREFFRTCFGSWTRSFRSAHRAWGYLDHEELLRRAHEDASHMRTRHGDVILRSNLPAVVRCDAVGDEEAERLADLVDPQLADELVRRVRVSVKRPAHGVDWRKRYFAEATSDN